MFSKCSHHTSIEDLERLGSYGHLVHHGPVCGAASEVQFAGGINEQQGSTLLLEDVGYAQHAVEHLVTVKLTQGQYDALVSFTYNEGAGRLQSSTLLKMLNAGNYAGARFIVLKSPDAVTLRS